MAMGKGRLVTWEPRWTRRRNRIPKDLKRDMANLGGTSDAVTLSGAKIHPVRSHLQGTRASVEILVKPISLQSGVLRRWGFLIRWNGNVQPRSYSREISRSRARAQKPYHITNRSRQLVEPTRLGRTMVQPITGHHSAAPGREYNICH